MKKTVSLLLALLLVFCAACAEQAPGYDVVLGADNPIPEIADRVRPAVVVVRCTTTTWDSETGLTTTLETSSGSGVYVDERGYIITNNHVVSDADDVEVEWLDGTKMPAEIIGQDDGYDVALLKVNGEEIKDVEPVELGDSDQLRIGELAIAIGNPGNSDKVLYGTVTAGIISGLQRSDVNAGNFSRALNVIQTDAAINTGSSGGALLNAKGELIGIPTLKIMLSESAIYEGLGFAIPVNSIMPFVNSLIETGKFSRPQMGFSVYENIGPEEPLKHYPPSGLVIDEIDPGSEAEAAGLQLNDVITHINGTRVHTYIEMTAVTDAFEAGDTVTVTVIRYYDETGEQLNRPITIDASLELQIIE